MPETTRVPSTTFNRPPRIQFPALPQGDFEIPAPPNERETPDQSILITILPVMGIGMMALFYVWRATTDNTGSSIFFAIPMLFLAFFTIGGTLLAQRWRRREYQRRRAENELNYLRVLDRRRVRLQAAQDAQLALLNTLYLPATTALTRAFHPDERLWERRPEDADFLQYRLGMGRITSSITPRPPLPDVHTPLATKALELADRYRTLPNAPVVASFLQDWSLGVYGKRSEVLANLRALLTHLVLAHTPQDLQIFVIASPSSAHEWRWLKWLPHTSKTQRGGVGDFVAFDTERIRNLSGMLGQLIDERKEDKAVSRLPHLLVILDNPQPAEYEAVYATLLREGYLVGASIIVPATRFEELPSDCRAVLHIDGETQFRYRRADGYELVGNSVDTLAAQDADHLARALGSLHIVESGSSGRIPQTVEFLDLYGARFVDELPERIAERWRRQIPRGILPHPVPIGRESLAIDTLLLLDEENHGPHGVLAGTTGSGKSELLQSLVCSLALEHDPRLLNLLLIDFKGGSTFNVFADLPHTVGMVTNLDGVRVRRVLEALKAEIQWRQQFLKHLNLRDITQYHRYYARTDDMVQNPDYHPLPHLFILVDEFAQLAREMPDFLRELVRTAQIGRSLGLHLILGTQSPMDVITDEMNANMQFRICLRVQNIEASRAMLRRPDAAYLPANQPGRGYFQVGERGVFKQFQTAYAGGDYLPSGSAENAPIKLELLSETGKVINLAAESSSASPYEMLPYTVARALVDTVREYARSQGIPRQRPLLLPPLEDRFTLDDVGQRVALGGWNGRTWRNAGLDEEGNPIQAGSAPVGLMDDVYTRTQHPLWIHLNASGQERSGKDGHVIVVGAPGTGKTMFIRTLALSQALLHPPEALHMYFISFTGTGLNDLGYLPHADRVIQGTETERLRRLFGRLIHTLEERQANPSLAFQPIIMVAIDQYEQFRETCRDTHLNDFERLINEGRAVGIYLVITASSVNAIPDRVRSLIQQRIILHAGSAGDYILLVGRMTSPMDDDLPPGRGYVYNSPPLLCHVALPTRHEGLVDAEFALYDLAVTVHELRQGYLALHGLSEDSAAPAQMQAPAPITELPTRIALDSLPYETSVERILTPIGRRDDDALNVFTLDWDDAGPDFIVTGPPASGKTNFLQTVVLAAAQQYSPQAVRFLLIDFNQRSLRALAPLKHVIKRVTDPQELRQQLILLHAELQSLRGESESAATFPATVVVIDDYDATAEALAAEPDLLKQLRDLIRLYGDGGFYLWVASYLERTTDPLIKQLLLRRSGFAMMMRESLQKLYVRVSGLPVEAMPEGRAYFPQHNAIEVVQTALVEQPQVYVQRLNAQWGRFPSATWLHTGQTPTEGEKPAAPAQPATLESSIAHFYSLDIDTAGLLEDLLGEENEE